ncbi:FtsK/SpoIIIE domain-containing protein [Paenarthrobacter sp. JL.01a]|uniref:FtsK/SpoIIIE domain-containing protein n=1 Tax=Paenarthrobacter sp. JL.01a TaxID=2979324 RepID=UPI0021C5685F|nr:FtsK/SpoIIIE domain-containing protein [Paenarthrobacter sp. JL.01a]UXM90328.1 FtsK/SpoIIIE domain-containing protein [Paenarthrobacter sp. JL.01a]
MRFECTLVRGPGAAASAGPEELSIAVAPGTSGSHLAYLLKAARDTGPLRVGMEDLAKLTVGLPPLVSGAVLVDGLIPPPQTPDPPLPLMLLVHTGPGAGSVFRIARGQHGIGRAAADISIADPTMSRHHAVLEVSGKQLEIAAVSASNPVYVDGRPTRRLLVNSRSSIVCGRTSFSLSSDSTNFPVLATDAGRSVKDPVEVPGTRTHGDRATIALAAGLPLIAGVGLAAATGMWMYLAFTSLSALGVLLPLMRGRQGRQHYRRALDRAVEDDAGRRRRRAPSAAEIMLAAFAKDPAAHEFETGGAHPTPQPDSKGEPRLENHAVWLRLGTTESSANIRVVPEDPHFTPPRLGPCPVTLDPEHRSVAILGDEGHVEGLLRFMLMQLAGFPASADAPVIILGPTGRLPLSARFLPQVTLASNTTAALATLNTLRHNPHGRLVVMGSPAFDDDEAVRKTVQTAHRVHWQVLHCQGATGASAGTITIEPSGTAASFESDGERLDFVPDLVPADVFDLFCRTVAAAASTAERRREGELPRSSSLAALLPYGHRRVLNRWRSASWKDGVTAVLGEGHDGPLTFNFKRDGPHLLVAGTTGSGKSELLRTLVASIALSVPPEQATFLFLDFKGGSGLGPLASLPHCLGLLTDLSRQNIDRALESLRGEVKYREGLFAVQGAADLADYQKSVGTEGVGLAHLFLVIDEFRILVDEAPAALRELMRIATIGRSLGIHLVMATQRPQGALTADIRANVTSSIALRVQSDMESVDIINSKDAASIGVDVPGRAFLATAAKEPQEFQTASLSYLYPDTAPSGSAELAASIVDPLRPVVQSAAQALGESPATVTPGALRGVPRMEKVDNHTETGVERLVSVIGEAWGYLGKPSPRSPIAAPLPQRIPWEDRLAFVEEPPGMPDSVAEPWRVGPIALLDKPTLQRVDCLYWLPATHGHLAMVGGPSSGMTHSFRAVAAMLATQAPQPHLYILDANRLLCDVEAGPEIGAYAGLDQLGFAARILSRLAAEMETRRAAPDLPDDRSPLVVIVAGWCSWMSALRGGSYEWAEGMLHDIARDGGPLGITLLISGERELVSSRLFAAIPNRAYFPLGTTEESRFHWPRLPEMEAVPGRAFVSGNIVESRPATAQFREAPAAGTWPFGKRTAAEPPFRLRPLPLLLTHEDFLSRKDASPPSGYAPVPTLQGAGGDSYVGGAPSAATERGGASSDGAPHEKLQLDPHTPEPLWIGVAGDDASPAAFPLKTRGVSIVLGSPRSGKTTVLRSLVSLNPEIPWLFPPDGSAAGAFWASKASAAADGNLNPQSVLLVDDVDSLDATGRRALDTLADQVAGIILTATPGPALHHLPLVKEVQASGMGLLLAHGSPLDGELLGVRLPADPGRRPGRGFIIDRGEAIPFQGVLSAGFPTPE